MTKPSNDLAALRFINEDDITSALDGSYVQLPLTTPAQVLEAVQRLIDLKCGEIET